MAKVDGDDKPGTGGTGNPPAQAEINKGGREPGRGEVDKARLEAEVRAARLEAQLQVMQMAYNDLRKEANRLRETLDKDRAKRQEQASAEEKEARARALADAEQERRTCCGTTGRSGVRRGTSKRKSGGVGGGAPINRA